jgi:hypothetical protein
MIRSCFVREGGQREVVAAISIAFGRGDFDPSG